MGNNVTNLPVNADLSTMNEALNKVQEEALKKAQEDELSHLCQMISRHDIRPKATQICNDCITQLCDDCADLHSKVPITKSHILVPVQASLTEETEKCELHKRPVKYVCTECTELLCVECTMDEKHGNHLESICDFRDAILKMKHGTEELVKECLSVLSHSAPRSERLNKELVKVNEAYNTTMRMKEELEEHVNKINVSLNMISNDKKMLEDAATVFKQNKRKVEAWMAELKMTSQMDDFKYFKEVLPLEKKITAHLSWFNDTDSEKQYTMCYLDSDLMDIGLNVPVLTLKREQFCSNPVLLRKRYVLKWEVNGEQGLEFTEPSQIIAINTESALVVDRRKGLQHIDTHGRLIKSFHYNVYSAAFDESINLIYIVPYSANMIYKTSLHNDTWKMAFDLPKDPCYILVQNDSLVACHWNDASLIFYTVNICDVKLKLRISLQNPQYISKISSNNMEHIIVTGENGPIHVYTDEGSPVSKIGAKGRKDGQLLNPKATAVTTSGHILVADHGNDRISEFTLDGTFIRHVLTSEDGLRSPCGLAYCEPYLWVTEYEQSKHRSVKLFQFE